MKIIIYLKDDQDVQSAISKITNTITSLTSKSPNIKVTRSSGRV